MSYIPDDAEWYLADIVLEFKVEGEAGNLVHLNLTLVHAHSPQEAYAHAIELGKQGEMSYQNTDGKRVDVRFCGLRDLFVIYEGLTHGSEILYEERDDVPVDQLAEMVRPQEELSVFRA